MEPEVKKQITDAEQKMKKAIEHLQNELIKVRAGKANPQMIESIEVDAYGSTMALKDVASINTPDAASFVVQAWDKNLLEPIEKGILKANVGLTPMNNGEIIRINVPPLSEERRKQLVKQVKNECEDAKVSIRNARRDANDTLKKLKKSGTSEDIIKDAETQVQKITDNYSKKTDDLVAKKEQEIMKV